MTCTVDLILIIVSVLALKDIFVTSPPLLYDSCNLLGILAALTNRLACAMVRCVYRMGLINHNPAQKYFLQKKIDGRVYRRYDNHLFVANDNRVHIAIIWFNDLRLFDLAALKAVLQHYFEFELVAQVVSGSACKKR